MAVSPSTEQPGPAAVAGTCSGFAVHSALPFRTLRSGGPGESLFVRHDAEVAHEGELLGEWLPRADNPFHGRLLRTGRTYAFWASDAGWFVIDPRDGSMTISAPDGFTLTAEVRMFGIPASIIALEHGDLPMHASAVEIEGRAVLFAGPSRHGKTTLAAGFAAAGHRVLTEDMTRFSIDRGAAVYPGPAVMRLRRDVADGMSTSMGSSMVTEGDRVFVLIDPAERGGGAAVPLAAILLLRDASGPSRLVPASPVDAIRDLWALSFGLPSEASHANVFERVTDLTRQVPVLDLHRELRLERMSEVVELVEQLVTRRTVV